MDRQSLLSGVAALVVLAFLSLPVLAQQAPEPAVLGEDGSKRAASAGVARAEEDSSGVRTLTLPQPIAVKGVPGCTTARILMIRASADQRRLGEPALIQDAIRSGKPVWVANGQCGTDGVVQGTGISVEAEAAVIDPCTLPMPSGRHPGCKK